MKIGNYDLGTPIEVGTTSENQFYYAGALGAPLSPAEYHGESGITYTTLIDNCDFGQTSYPSDWFNGKDFRQVTKQWDTKQQYISPGTAYGYGSDSDAKQNPYKNIDVSYESYLNQLTYEVNHSDLSVQYHHRDNQFFPNVHSRFNTLYHTSLFTELLRHNLIINQNLDTQINNSIIDNIIKATRVLMAGKNMNMGSGNLFQGQPHSFVEAGLPYVKFRINSNIKHNGSAVGTSDNQLGKIDFYVLMNTYAHSGVTNVDDLPLGNESIYDMISLGGLPSDSINNYLSSIDTFDLQEPTLNNEFRDFKTNLENNNFLMPTIIAVFKEPSHSVTFQDCDKFNPQPGVNPVDYFPLPGQYNPNNEENKAPNFGWTPDSQFSDQNDRIAKLEARAVYNSSFKNIGAHPMWFGVDGLFLQDYDILGIMGEPTINPATWAINKMTDFNNVVVPLANAWNNLYTTAQNTGLVSEVNLRKIAVMNGRMQKWRSRFGDTGLIASINTNSAIADEMWQSINNACWDVDDTLNGVHWWSLPENNQGTGEQNPPASLPTLTMQYTLNHMLRMFGPLAPVGYSPRCGENYTNFFEISGLEDESLDVTDSNLGHTNFEFNGGLPIQGQLAAESFYGYNMDGLLSDFTNLFPEGSSTSDAEKLLLFDWECYKLFYDVQGYFTRIEQNVLENSIIQPDLFPGFSSTGFLLYTNAGFLLSNYNQNEIYYAFLQVSAPGAMLQGAIQNSGFGPNEFQYGLNNDFQQLLAGELTGDVNPTFDSYWTAIGVEMHKHIEMFGRQGQDGYLTSNFTSEQIGNAYNEFLSDYPLPSSYPQIITTSILNGISNQNFELPPYDPGNSFSVGFHQEFITGQTQYVGINYAEFAKFLIQEYLEQDMGPTENTEFLQQVYTNYPIQQQPISPTQARSLRTPLDYKSSFINSTQLLTPSEKEKYNYCRKVQSGLVSWGQQYDTLYQSAPYKKLIRYFEPNGAPPYENSIYPIDNVQMGVTTGTLQGLNPYDLNQFLLFANNSSAPSDAIRDVLHQLTFAQGGIDAYELENWQNWLEGGCVDYYSNTPPIFNSNYIPQDVVSTLGVFNPFNGQILFTDNVTYSGDLIVTYTGEVFNDWWSICNYLNQFPELKDGKIDFIRPYNIAADGDFTDVLLYTSNPQYTPGGVVQNGFYPSNPDAPFPSDFFTPGAPIRIRSYPGITITTNAFGPPPENRGFAPGTGIIEMINTLISEGITGPVIDGYPVGGGLEGSDGDGIYSYEDGLLFVERYNDYRPLQLINYALENNIMNLLYNFLPINSTATNISDYAIGELLQESSPLLIENPITAIGIFDNTNNAIKSFDSILGNDTTEGYFSDGPGADGMKKSPTFEEASSLGYQKRGDDTLNGSNIFTQSINPTNHAYYFTITNGSPDDPSSTDIFDVSFGHIRGSGSLGLAGLGGQAGGSHGVKSPSEAVYRQAANELIGEGSGSFFSLSQSVFHEQSVGTLDTQVSYMSPNPNPDEFIWILRSKQNLQGNKGFDKFVEINLSGSDAAGNGVSTKLSVDSVGFTQQNGLKRHYLFKSPAVNPGHLTGGVYGYWYPEVGTFIINSKITETHNGFNSLASVQFNSPLARHNGMKPNAIAFANYEANNALKLVNNLRNATTSGEEAIKFLRLEKGQGSSNNTQLNILGCIHLTPNQFNFTTNPTRFVSMNANGEYETFNDTMKYDEGLNTSPTTYITQVDLYDDKGYKIATSKLSKPIKKDFNSEVVIKFALTDY